MNIRNEWERLGLSQKVWIGLAGAVILLVVAIGCFKLLEPQPWYLFDFQTDTCINARLQAAELGQPQMANPYKLGSWEQKNSNRYEATRTHHFSRGQGAEVVVTNSGPWGYMFYFSKKSTCLTYKKTLERMAKYIFHYE